MRHEGLSREHIHKWDRFIDVETMECLLRNFVAENRNVTARTLPAGEFAPSFRILS